MERFQLLKPVFSTSLPDRLRKTAAFATWLRQGGKEAAGQLQQTLHGTTTHIGNTAQDIALVLMRAGLQAAADMQRFFLNDISMYSCLQYAASLLKQAMTLLRK